MKYLLVTGAASGIGKAIVETMARRGWKVFATDKNKDVLRSMEAKNIIPIYMDVTKDKSVLDAFMKVAKETLYLDAIINCAGVRYISSLIEDDPKKVEKALNVNVIGMMRVNNVFFPLLNKEEGRIINMSSESGWLSPSPFNGADSISKYAVEAYNDTLRRELNFLGVKVIKIEPGPFKTPMRQDTIDSFKESLENTKYFKEELKALSKIMKSEFKSTSNIKHLMNTIIKACESKNPKICYRVRNNKDLVALNLLPEESIDKVYFNELKKK
jgi:NAD(P)-dependent dehydrogenase (short-subunit alcohol dehydrogenase family)